MSGSKLRWRIAYFLDRSKHRCWADAVSWALKTPDVPLRQRGEGDRCRAESTTHRDGTCYCGKFCNGALGSVGEGTR